MKKKIQENGDVEVKHIRHEECVKGTFQVQWKETIEIPKTFETLTSVTLYVTDLIFNPETREPTRYEIQNLLKDFLPSVDLNNKTTTVMLPSFVDLSNQKLTEIPESVFNMTQLQTLYLHFNQIERFEFSIEISVFNIFS